MTVRSTSASLLLGNPVRRSPASSVALTVTEPAMGINAPAPVDRTTPGGILEITTQARSPGAPGIRLTGNATPPGAPPRSSRTETPVTPRVGASVTAAIVITSDAELVATLLARLGSPGPVAVSVATAVTPRFSAPLKLAGGVSMSPASCAGVSE